MVIIVGTVLEELTRWRRCARSDRNSSKRPMVWEGEGEVVASSAPFDLELLCLKSTGGMA